MNTFFFPASARRGENRHLKGTRHHHPYLLTTRNRARARAEENRIAISRRLVIFQLSLSIGAGARSRTHTYTYRSVYTHTHTSLSFYRLKRKLSPSLFLSSATHPRIFHHPLPLTFSPLYNPAHTPGGGRESAIDGNLGARFLSPGLFVTLTHHHLLLLLLLLRRLTLLSGCAIGNPKLERKRELRRIVCLYTPVRRRCARTRRQAEQC